MADALHPQTFLTYGMNGHELPVGNAARFVSAYRASSDTKA